MFSRRATEEQKAQNRKRIRIECARAHVRAAERNLERAINETARILASGILSGPEYKATQARRRKAERTLERASERERKARA